jgi:outer membrane protein assembly factor BamB
MNRKLKWGLVLVVLGVCLAAWFLLGGNGRLISEETVARFNIVGTAPDGRFVAYFGDKVFLRDRAGVTESNSIGGLSTRFRGGLVLTNGVLFSLLLPGGGGGIEMTDWAGKSLWSYQTNSPISKPAVDLSGNVYFYGPNWVVHSLDPVGNVRWTYPYPSVAAGFQFCAPAVSPDGRVAVCGASPGGLIMLDQDGNELWRNADLATDVVRSGVVFVENGDLLVSHGWSLRQFDQSGKLIWMLHLPNVPNNNSPYLDGLPIVAKDGTIYCLGEDRVIAISPDGEFKWSHVLSNASKKSWRTNWGGDWGKFTPKGDVLVFAGDFEDLQPAIGFGPNWSAVRNERVVCLGLGGDLKWKQTIPLSMTWSIPKTISDLEVAWKTRMGQRTTKYPRFITIDPDGTIYVSGHVDHKTKIWAIDGN